MTGSKVKRRVFYGVTSLTAVFLTVMLGFGLVFPVLAWFPESMLFDLMDEIEPGALTHRLHELTVGILSWALVLAVFLQFHKPERKVAPLLQALAVPMVLTVVEVVNGNFVVAETAPLLTPILLVGLLHPRARDLVRLGRLDTRLAGLTALAAVPWIVFALGQSRLQRLDVAGDVHAEAGHWGLMAGFAIVVLAWGLIGASDRPGWRIPAFSTALSSVLYGIHSLVFSQVASTASVGWALAAIVWGSVYGVTAWRRATVDEIPAESAALRIS